MRNAGGRDRPPDPLTCGGRAAQKHYFHLWQFMFEHAFSGMSMRLLDLIRVFEFVAKYY